METKKVKKRNREKVILSSSSSSLSSSSNPEIQVSSESLDSGWEESNSDKIVEKKTAKHFNRTKLVNKSIKELNARIVWIYLHGAVLSNPKRPMCITRQSPFTHLFRYIFAAPGIANTGTYIPPETIDVSTTTPNILAEYLSTELDPRTTNDLDATVFSMANGHISLGRKNRHHKLINYRSSPYCLKELFIDETNKSKFGIFLFSENGETKVNLLLDVEFQTWLKENISEFLFDIIHDVGRGKIVSRVPMDALFQYLKEKKSINNLFVIDFTCEGLRHREFPYAIKIDETNEELIEHGKVLGQMRNDLQRKKNKTQDEKDRLETIETMMNEMEKQMYTMTKRQMPSIRNLKKYQSRAKQNKQRWHIIKKGDTLLR